MSQADEDEMWYFNSGFDDMDPEPPDCGLLPARYGWAPRRVTVDLFGTIELQDLHPGETFTFPNAVNVENVYMVISSPDHEGEWNTNIHYVLLNKGQVYSSSPSKRVTQVDVRVSVD